MLHRAIYHRGPWNNYRVSDRRLIQCVCDQLIKWLCASHKLQSRQLIKSTSMRHRKYSQLPRFPSFLRRQTTFSLSTAETRLPQIIQPNWYELIQKVHFVNNSDGNVRALGNDYVLSVGPNVFVPKLHMLWYYCRFNSECIKCTKPCNWTRRNAMRNAINPALYPWHRLFTRHKYANALHHRHRARAPKSNHQYFAKWLTTLILLKSMNHVPALLRGTTDQMYRIKKVRN